MGVLDSSYIKTIGVKSPGHKKIFFILSDTLMHSFPNMYNTMGSKMDGLAVTEHFLSKIAEKTAFWAATFSDHLTSERSSTHNFKD